jgi:hypothetical protein
MLQRVTAYLLFSWNPPANRLLMYRCSQIRRRGEGVGVDNPRHRVCPQRDNRSLRRRGIERAIIPHRGLLGCNEGLLLSVARPRWSRRFPSQCEFEIVDEIITVNTSSLSSQGVIIRLSGGRHRTQSRTLMSAVERRSRTRHRTRQQVYLRPEEPTPSML